MQSVFNNNGNYGGNYGGAAGYRFSDPNALQWTNPLKPEEERELHRGAQALSLDIPKESMYRAKCTHRDPATHQFTVRPADDGNGYVCTKCGAQFNIVNNSSMKEINEIIGGAIDILQTTKMMYVDMTPEVIQAYFVILPFLELAPKMYEAAVNTFNKISPQSLNPSYAPNNYYNAYYGLVGGMTPPQTGYSGMFPNAGMGYMGYPQYPMNGAGMGVPTGPVPDASNPMMATGAPVAPSPVVPAGAVAPNAVPNAGAQAPVPAEGTPVTSTNKYSLA